MCGCQAVVLPASEQTKASTTTTDRLKRSADPDKCIPYCISIHLRAVHSRYSHLYFPMAQYCSTNDRLLHNDSRQRLACESYATLMGDKIFSDKRVLINTLSLCYNTMSSNTNGRLGRQSLNRMPLTPTRMTQCTPLKTYKPTAPHSEQG